LGPVEELFTVILLTLINVIEIIYMMTGSLLPLAAILIFFILILVFMAVFMMRRRLFWKLALLAFIINLLNLGYMFLRAGGAIALYLALFVNIAGILFVAIQPKKAARRKPGARPGSEATKCARIEDRINEKEPILAREEQTARHGLNVEEFIRQLEEQERLKKQEAPAARKTDAEKAAAGKTAVDKAVAGKAVAEKAVAEKAIIKKASVKKRFSPGKFVASKTGRQYHKPKCEWANNIKKQNRVWFLSEKEAEKKGLTAHWCLKKR
jgi:hypothetical protein